MRSESLESIVTTEMSVIIKALVEKSPRQWFILKYLATIHDTTRHGLWTRIHDFM